MAVAKSFSYRHIEMKKLELLEGQAIIDDNKFNEIGSFEGIMDNFSFECVWQEPKEKQMINQFLEDEVDFFDETRGRCTPDFSELMSALSSSFPSGSLEEAEVVAKPCYKEPSTSTPMRPKSGEGKKMEFSEFDAASPIVSTSAKPQVFMLRRCRLKLEDDEEFVGDCKLKLKNL